jgi:hypothetical protein
MAAPSCHLSVALMEVAKECLNNALPLLFAPPIFLSYVVIKAVLVVLHYAPLPSLAPNRLVPMVHAAILQMSVKKLLIYAPLILQLGALLETAYHHPLIALRQSLVAHYPLLPMLALMGHAKLRLPHAPPSLPPLQLLVLLAMMDLVKKLTFATIVNHQTYALTVAALPILHHAVL